MIKHRLLSNRFPSAFVLLSLASRFAAALKLNHESPNLCFLAQESRRRLMWSLYCVDAGISGGNRDHSLWRAERIFLGLPCNERNFEFDLPQETEKLIPDPNPPPSAQAEDVGSLALHIRIQHIRHKISEFTKDSLTSDNIHPANLQTQVLSLHRELEDFAAHLPVSFQFSENSLRLRAYSPRICAFVMIHIWWRQCHCDLYRLGLVGLREALPTTVLERFDGSFIEHCQRQCVDHAMAMASIFAHMQKLGAKPVADLDLGICAYQCARMLRYAYHANSGNLNISQDIFMEQFKTCLQAVKECCTGIAAAGIRSDIEKLIAYGLGPRTTPVQTTMPTETARANRSSGMAPSFGNGAGVSGRNVGNMIASPPASATTMQSNSHNEVFSSAAPTAQMTALNTSSTQVPHALLQDPWTPGAASAGADSDMALDVQDDFNDPSGQPSELNNAFEGATDDIGLDNGLDYAMGLDVGTWGANPGNWSNDQYVNSASDMGGQ